MTAACQKHWRRLPWWSGGMLAVLLVCGVPALLLAHARLSRSLPMSSAVVTQLPAEVRCWFSEPIDVRFSAITVLRAVPEATTGKPQPQERVDQGWQEGPQVTREAAVRLPADLAPGLYLVQWTIFAVDGHKAAGTFSWTYRPASAGDGQPARSTP